MMLGKPLLFVLVFSLSSFSAADAPTPEMKWECRSPIRGTFDRVDRLNSLIAGQQKNLDGLLRLKEQFDVDPTHSPKDFHAIYSLRLERDQWRLALYELAQRILNGEDLDTGEKDLEDLAQTIPIHPSDNTGKHNMPVSLVGYDLLNLYWHIGEFSDLNFNIDPAVYDLVMSAVSAEVRKLQVDGKTDPNTLAVHAMRLAMTKIHFGHELYRIDEVERGLEIIEQIPPETTRIKPVYHTYATSYGYMALGEITGRLDYLRRAITGLDYSVSQWGHECGPTLAARASYHLMGTYLLASAFTKSDEGKEPYLWGAAEAGKSARMYADLLHAPDEWRAVQRRSSDVFTALADNILRRLGRKETRYERYTFLAKRSYELSITN